MWTYLSVSTPIPCLQHSDISGLETYYFDSGRRLAWTIHNTILGVLSETGTAGKILY